MTRSPRSFVLLALLAAVATLLAAGPVSAVNISGTLVGKASGKPLAKAWVGLGRVGYDRDKNPLDLTITEFSAVTDASGRFEIKGAPAGPYTIIYKTAPAAMKPGKMSVEKLGVGVRSIMPMMRGREIGTSSPFDQRLWVGNFTLLKGHTLYVLSVGTTMKIWNATAKAPNGVFVEMRKGAIWTQDFQKDAQLKLEAWSH